MPPRRRKQLSPVREELGNLSLSAQEEVQHVESGIDSEVGKKKEKKKTQLTMKEMVSKTEKMTAEMISDGFKGVFNSKGKEEVDSAVRLFTQAYNKTKVKNLPVSKDLFFKAFDCRLGFIMESNCDIAVRRRVLNAVAIFAISTLKAGDSNVLEFILSFVKTTYLCQFIEVRINTMILIGSLINFSRGKGGLIEKPDDMNDRKFEDLHHIPLEFFKKIYLIILEARTDKPEVRVECINALTPIQSDPIPSNFEAAVEKSPKDIIIKSLKDEAIDVRLIAVEKGQFNGTVQHDTLSKMAMTDSHTKVRCAALAKFGQKSMRSLESGPRLDLLYTSVLDHDSIVQEAVRTMLIDKWITSYSEVHRELLTRSKENEDLDVIEVNGFIRDDRNAHSTFKPSALQIIAFSFDYEKGDEVMSKTDVVVKVMIERTKRLMGCHRESSAYFAREFVTDRHADDFLFFLYRKNFKQLLDLKPLAQLFVNCFGKQLVNFPEDIPVVESFRLRVIYLWRLFMEFTTERAHSEHSAWASTFELAPDLVTTCQVVEQLIKYWQENPVLGMVENVDEAHDIRQLTLLQLLKGLRLIEKEKCGMEKWKGLLLMLLKVESNTKPVVDRIIIDLKDNFFPDADVLYKEIEDITVLKLMELGAYTDNEQRKSRNSGENEEDDLNTTILHDPLVDRYETMMLNALMKTGSLTISTQIEEKCRKIFCRSLESTAPDEIEMAMECSGICTINNIENIDKLLEFVIPCISVCRDKGLLLSILVELCISYGFDLVDEKIVTVSKIANVKSGSPCYEGLLEMLEGFIIRTYPDEETMEFVLAVCEATCKIFLTCDVVSIPERSQRTFVSLLFRLNHRPTHSSAFSYQIRSLLTTFTSAFATYDVKNQEFIRGCFKLVFGYTSEQQEDSIVDEFHYNDAKHMVPQFAHLTSNDFRPADEEHTIHVDFLMDAVAALNDEEELENVRDFYAKLLPWLDISNGDKDELRKIAKDLLMSLRIGEDTGAFSVNDVKKMIKRIERELGETVLEVKQENDEEIPSADARQASPEPMDTAAPEIRTTRRGRKPGTATKKGSTAKKADVVSEMRRHVDSPTNMAEGRQRRGRKRI